MGSFSSKWNNSSGSRVPPWESVFPALRDAPRALLEDGLVMEDCVGSRLGPGSAIGAFELSLGINETWTFTRGSLEDSQ